jgi:nucleotide-binding universal stress UspA family protein
MRFCTRQYILSSFRYSDLWYARANMSFKRILCAVDFSHGSLEAFRVAVEMARLYRGSLHLFHAIEAQPAVPSEVVVEIVKRANAAMEELVASAQSSLDGPAFTSEITSGRAFVEIVSRAREWKADLIVLGSKGTGSLEDMIIGTVEQVTMKAPCSVLVVRPSPARDRPPAGT